jgi:hypothetical protein
MKNDQKRRKVALETSTTIGMEFGVRLGKKLSYF